MARVARPHAEALLFQTTGAEQMPVSAEVRGLRIYEALRPITG